MAKTASGWLYNSLILNFITQPFRWGLVMIIAIGIVFGSSIISQSCFGTADELDAEIESLNQQAAQTGFLSLEKKTSEPVNVTVTRGSYWLLHGVFFEVTQINRAWQAQQEDEFGYAMKQRFLIPQAEKLARFDRTLKLISVRIGHLSYFIGLALLLSAIGLVDGFVARAIRQKNVGRESAGLYHRAKYWRTGILWFSMIIYLASPVALSANWLFLPCLAYAALVWLQAKYLKKYL